MSAFQSNPSPALLAVVPAAGVGRRMGSATPKQYLPLCGRTVIEYAIQPLCEHPDIREIVVSISADDTHWADLPIASHRKISTVVGGSERCHSVLNALNYFQEQSSMNLASPAHLVMVHDAARPCLSRVDLDKLITETRQQRSGALLGVKVRDTIKKVNRGSVIISETIDRADLWHAQTPQMFPIGMLANALRDAIDQHKWVTDEASAMELAGFFPIMVEGSETNIKITRPEDLELAEYYLNKSKRE